MVSLPWPPPVRGQLSSSKRGGEPINCRFMDIKCSSNLFDRLSLCEQLGGDLDLLRIQLRGRPKRTPRFLAASRPAPVRSRMRSRSNSAIPAKTVIIILSACVVVLAQGSDID